MARRSGGRMQTCAGASGSLRCAIYTRKSAEEGLDQDFNSLHAQREACKAFILSQRSEGWVLVPEPYDDGGLSGDAWRLPAEPLERAVRQALVGLLRDADHVHDLIAESGSADQHQQLLRRIDALIADTGSGNGSALRELLTTLAARIEVGPESLTLSISRAALMHQLDPAADRDEPDQRLVSRRPLMLRKRGVETRLVVGDIIFCAARPGPHPTRR